MAMKKILAAIVILTYLSVSTGFIISTHFCMDEFDSATLGSSGSDKCRKCGMHNDGGCCRNEVKVVKLETSHHHAQALVPSFELAPAETETSVFISHSFQAPVIEKATMYHGPPFSSSPVYLQICVFRI